MLEGLEPTKNRVYYCKVDLLKKELDTKDYQILIDAIADADKWSAKGLQTALRTRGVILADTTITKHRNQVCNCFRD
jgi:hypothetical protein